MANYNNPTAEDLENFYTEKLTEYNSLLKSKNDTTEDLSLSSSAAIVNIYRDYPWRINYNNSSALREKTPSLPLCYIREYRQNLSTLASTMIWLSMGAAKGLADLNGPLSSFINSVDNEYFKKLEQDTGNSFNRLIASSPELQPYKYMYSAADTNIKYIFPYYDNAITNITNNYGDEPSGADNMLNQTVSTLLNVATKTTALTDGLEKAWELFSHDFNSNERGILIERPQYYQASAGNDSLTVNFPLYNTIPTGYDNPWQRNYYFIMGLIFKNLPFKISMFRYLSPVLYNVIIPGINHYPISYISNLNITSSGISRNLTLNDKIVMVPEMWEISITFTSLLSKTANLWLSSTNSTGPNIHYK